jgi:DNA-directed RNA polymerase subunit F
MICLQESSKALASAVSVQLSIHCSARVLKHVQNHFKMTVEEGDLKGNLAEFASYCKKFNDLYFDHSEEAIDEFDSLGADEHKWDTAALKLLELFAETRGIYN